VFHEPIVTFLEATVVFLLITNAVSIAATTLIIHFLNGVADAKRPPGIIERKLNTMLLRAP